MNRYDPNAPRQQAGGYSDSHGSHDAPRQAGQWQAAPGRQAGGDWDYDDGQTLYRREERSGRPSDNQLGGMPAREDQEREEYGSLERAYRADPRTPRAGRAYRSHLADRYYDAGYPADYAPFTSEDFGGRDFSARSGWAGGGIRSSDTYRPSYGLSRGDWTGFSDYGDWRDYGERRGFFERAGDEIASWFGDEDAARRREIDHRGRGPSDYTRSDERIREDVNDSLTHDWRVDASQIRVTVKNGEVTLDGMVDSRAAKRRAEDLAEDVSGVRHVQNNLRMHDTAMTSTTAATTGTATKAL